MVDRRLAGLLRAKSARLYYGTSISNIKHIFKEGIYAGEDGYVLCAAEPNTASLHSTIRILSKTSNPEFSIPQNEKVVFSIDVPRRYIKESDIREENFLIKAYMNLGVNQMLNIMLWLTLKMKNHIPVDWIRGYMVKDDS